MRHYRRGFGFADLYSGMNGGAVLAGAGIGFLGALGGQYLRGMDSTGMAPDFLKRFAPFLGSLVFGGASYAIGRKNKARAKAHLTGAAAAGAIVQVWQELKSSFPALQGVYVTDRRQLSAVYARDVAGMRDAQLNGVYFTDPSQKMAALGALSAGNMQDLVTATQMGPVDPAMVLTNPGMYQ